MRFWCVQVASLPSDLTWSVVTSLLDFMLAIKVCLLLLSEQAVQHVWKGRKDLKLALPEPWKRCSS